MKRSLPSFLALFIFVVFLEIATRLGLMNGALFPPPSQIFDTLAELAPEFRDAFFQTAFATVLGYLASVVLGILIAIFLSFSEAIKRAILPFAIFFQTVPIIAIAPLLVIYFGFGSGTVIASALIVSIFPVLANTLIGLQSVDPGELELFRLYGATETDILRRLRIPRAYPSIYAGLKIAAGLSVIGAVAGEFVAGGGLGSMIDSARTQQRIDIVFAALLLLSVLGLILIGTLRLTNQQINGWRPYGLHLKD